MEQGRSVGVKAVVVDALHWVVEPFVAAVAASHRIAYRGRQGIGKLVLIHDNGGCSA